MSGPSVHATRLSLNLFSSREAALLLVSTKNRDLWEGSTSKVRDSRTSRHSAENTNRILCACLKSSLTEIRNEFSAHSPKIGPSQRSRFLLLTKRGAASGDENGLTASELPEPRTRTMVSDTKKTCLKRPVANSYKYSSPQGLE